MEALEVQTAAAKPLIYCRGCDYALVGLRSPRCPECGRRFDPADPRTFTRHPRLRHFVRRAAATLTLLAGLLAIAVALFYWQHTVHRDLIGRVKAAGCTYETDRIGPKWFNDRIARREWPVIETLVKIDFVAGLVTDRELERLEPLSRLKTLAFNGAQVTDVGAEHLRSLRHLETLEIFGSRITDAGLAAIGRLTRLQQLDLFSADITDEGLAHIARLGNLRRLSLGNTRITDRGLARLEPCAGLKFLDLSGTDVTDAGVEAIKQAIPGIEVLKP